MLTALVRPSSLPEEAGEGHGATDTHSAACMVTVTFWRRLHVPVLPSSMGDGARDTHGISLGGLRFDVLGTSERQG